MMYHTMCPYCRIETAHEEHSSEPNIVVTCLACGEKYTANNYDGKGNRIAPLKGPKKK